MKILVTGAAGQIGSELTLELRKKYGADNVIGTVHKTQPSDELRSGPMVVVDSTDKEALKAVIKEYGIDTVYHLVSLLSAVGEKKPDAAWHINMTGLKNVLDLAVEFRMKRVFWPSSIAAFGPSARKDGTPQDSMLDPNTMYGVTKVAGELLCNYYFHKYGLDVRSLRYPGLISYKTAPGGGTTDYAVAIFYDAIQKGAYECFVREDTVLPMMYMDDAIRATIELMEAEPEKITVRTSYNLAAISFSAEELAEEVKRHVPGFECTFVPDERQKIADSWPKIIDDSKAREDWGWKHGFDLSGMAAEMISRLKKKLV